MATHSRQFGLWLIGAHGGIGTTVALGIEALRRRLVQPAGLIGHLAPFNELHLAPLDRWIIGGHEIRQTTYLTAAREMHAASGLFGGELIAACRNWLVRCDRNIRHGTVLNCGATISGMADRAGVRRKRTAGDWVEALADDIRAFARRHRLAHVVVVNVASTEPPLRRQALRGRKRLSAADMSRLPASALYALAAIEAQASYINFTPSVSIDLPAIQARADARGLAYMGSDGKTGETLMKAVLAPMFAARNLRVLSWVGHNIFGNRDGVVLDDPANKATKMRSKDHLVHEILGYRPRTLVSIEYIESLGDWKTAWDHVHFTGFLGTKMALQFIWQASDSILAAPLVIELARFAELAARRGEGGPLTHLACFFKSPMGVREQSFARQYESLLAYARGARREHRDS